MYFYYSGTCLICLETLQPAIKLLYFKRTQMFCFLFNSAFWSHSYFNCDVKHGCITCMRHSACTILFVGLLHAKFLLYWPVLHFLVTFEWHYGCASEKRGSYTSGHFIWNLWNEPSARFINFIWNDHSCKILFIIHIWPFNIWFYRLQNELYFSKKMHCWHGRCQWRCVYAPKSYFTCGSTIFMTRC